MTDKQCNSLQIIWTIYWGQNKCPNYQHYWRWQDDNDDGDDDNVDENDENDDDDDIHNDGDDDDDDDCDVRTTITCLMTMIVHTTSNTTTRNNF